MELNQVQQEFVKLYGNGEAKSYLSPGRVNLIGEHTDYNGGCVFPCALSFGTYGVARKREDNIFNFSSTNFPDVVSVSLSEIEYRKTHTWANYLIGIVKEFQDLGHTLGGLDILISGNIPNGAGLSSSASIELLMSVILNDMFDCGVSMVDMVKLSQHAENHFIGMNCGIMDQYAVGMGKKGYAMFLDCLAITHEDVPVILEGAKLIIGNTNYRRGLTDSKYNERRSECEKAVEILQQAVPITCLADLTPEQFETNKHLITKENVLKRATHIVYEIERTKEAVRKLKEGDIISFGKLMNGSHDSLRDLYEVTGLHLDTLVSETLKIDGVIGSRMTGAGFGGCTISIVRDEAIPKMIEEVSARYKEFTGLTADFYIAEIGDGARLLSSNTL